MGESNTERTRNHHTQPMEAYDEDEDESTSDEELYATAYNNNDEEAKLIGIDERKCGRRRRFRSYKTRRTLKRCFIVGVVCVLFLVLSQFCVTRDTYRSGMYPLIAREPSYARICQ